MTKNTTDDHVLPRPVEPLPDLANAKSRAALAQRLIDAFDLSDSSASTIANAVVDPTSVRRTIGEASEPGVERVAVPGGTLLGVRTTVWTRRTMPDPRNPRTLPSRRHPFAIDPGTGGEDSRFRPLANPQPLDPAHPRRAELAVDIENRHHLTWAAQQAAAFVFAQNDWRESIRSQGIMEAVWLVATTYRHQDDFGSATALTTVEGSSRDTAAHDILGVHSADVPYDGTDASMRSRIRKLNEAYEGGDRDADLLAALRCERMPALILVGFEPHEGGTTGFQTAIKSLVALRHVDPPRPWGEGPENEALADEVLDELHRRDLISPTQRDYYAGSSTRAEAAAAHLSADPVLRAAEIVKLFTSPDVRVAAGIRVAVTSQSTRKRITPKLLNELATALVLRAVSEDRDRVDQIRRYLRHAFSKSVHREDWTATGRATDPLAAAALSEVRGAIAAGERGEPGPASLELSIRGAYPLVVSGRLNADRGTSNNQQPDRRTPGEVLDAMRRSVEGVRQLAQALHDHEAGNAIRAVDGDGEPRVRPDGSELLVTDIFLRNEFPPAGRVKPPKPGDTPTDRYDAALSRLSDAFGELQIAAAELREVRGGDDQPVVDSRGVDIQVADAWRGSIGEISDELVVWSHTYRRNHGKQNSSTEIPVYEEEEEDDPYAESDFEEDLVGN